MDLEEIEALLEEALELLPPTWGPDELPARKVELIEGHMVAGAYMSAQLIRARHWLRAANAALSEQWEALQGYEVAITKPRGKWTKQDVQAAKAQVSPQLFAAAKKGSAMRASLDDQIDRLEREDRTMSRLYTLIAA